MLAALSLVTLIALFVLVTKVATVALVHTGMGREAARFHARSALTGVGFPSTDAGAAVRHPVRRRIVMGLMLLGNVGSVCIVSTLVLSFAGEHAAPLVGRLGGIVLGALVVAALALSPHVDRALSRRIGRALRRWAPLERRDAASLLHLKEDYAVKELEVEEGDWLVDRPLGVLRLFDEGAVVLGIERGTGAWIGAPRKQTCIRAGDVIVVYGREKTLSQLDRRRDGSWGDREHSEAARELLDVRRLEEQQERALDEVARFPRPAPRKTDRGIPPSPTSGDATAPP